MYDEYLERDDVYTNWGVKMYCRVVPNNNANTGSSMVLGLIKRTDGVNG